MYFLVDLILLTIGVVAVRGAPQAGKPCDSYCKRDGELVCCDQVQSSATAVVACEKFCPENDYFVCCDQAQTSVTTGPPCNKFCPENDYFVCCEQPQTSGAPGPPCTEFCPENDYYVCCDQAQTSVTTDSSSPECQFPFIYKGVTYTACTTKDDSEGKLWCTTQTDNQNNHIKGKFKQCEGTSSPECQFPFVYKNVTYTTCTTKDDSEGKLWCSTQTDDQNNHIKGKFKHCQGLRSPECQFPFIYKNKTYTGCTTKDDSDGKLWCSTETDSQNNHVKGKFKHCQGSSLSECQFPFIYKDVAYKACTTKDAPDGQLWCSTQTDNQNNHIKGNLMNCQGTSLSECQFPFIYKDVSYTACTTKDDPDGKLWCSTKTDNQNNHIKGNLKNCQDMTTASSSAPLEPIVPHQPPVLSSD